MDPPDRFDASEYKNRNVVERAFSHMKYWRGLATCLRGGRYWLLATGARVRHTHAVPDSTTTPPSSRTARRAFAVNAGVAWLGLVLTVLLSGLGWYREQPLEPGLYGGHAEGAAGAVARLTDTLSYFTIWSNIVVAVSVTMLAARPERDSWLRRVLRLAGLLMITVTAIVYQVLLAPTAVVEGWSVLTDPILHVMTPLVTVAVWVVWGPHGRVTARVVPAALLLPLLWIAWMLARGSVIDAYPYGFANVTEHGYAAVALTLVAVLAFGLVVAAGYWALDVVIRRRARPVS